MDFIVWTIIAFMIFLVFLNSFSAKKIDKLKDLQEGNKEIFEDLEESIEDLKYAIEDLEDDFYELLEVLEMEVRECPEGRIIGFKEIEKKKGRK